MQIAAIRITFLLLAGSAISADDKLARFFIRAGQSEMEGQGFIAADEQRDGGMESLEFLVNDLMTKP